MNINQLIVCVADAYPDGLLQQYWNAKRRRPRDHAEAGDTLALAMVREIADTFDPDATDAGQVSAVIDALDRMSDDLRRSANILRNLKLSALLPNQKGLNR